MEGQNEKLIIQDNEILDSDKFWKNEKNNNDNKLKENNTNDVQEKISPKKIDSNESNKKDVTPSPSSSTKNENNKSNF